jgi:hypothetical protein
MALELPLQLDAFQSRLLGSVQQKAAVSLLAKQCTGRFRRTLGAAKLEGLLRRLLGSIALASQGAALSPCEQFRGVLMPTPILKDCQALSLHGALLSDIQLLLKLKHPLRRVLRLLAELSILVFSSADALLLQLICRPNLPKGIQKRCLLLVDTSKPCV